MPAITTARIELRPLPPRAAAALPEDRAECRRELGVALDPEWPQPDVVDILPRQAGLAREEAEWGIWVIVERSTDTVVGDIGFYGPPAEDGSLEIGFAVVPSRRRRGYASEAATALLAWATAQPGVSEVLARCDPGNEASIGTLRRAGFERAGYAGELLRWRLR